MDDYTSNVLNDSKNEWSILLINHITPHIIDGFRSIFNESVRICEENDELEKYLMTYQNLLARIPKWNQSMINAENERIVKLCNCSYLEDILTCVHIIQLKVLSCVRVGNDTKKIKIDIPDFATFLHNVYANISRKLYSSIYLFEIDIPSLEQQRRNREFELMVQTCIMNTIRDRIPVETLLRQFIDETQEVEVTKVEKLVETKPFVEPNTIVDTRPMSDSRLMSDTRPMSDSRPMSNSMSPMNMSPQINDNMPSFFNNNLQSQMNQMEREIKPSVGFSEQNSVLTFESPPNDDIISLGDEVSLTNLGFEDLDLSKPSESVKLDFEEL
jgi:hypothetical protein